ncbi:MAG: hypothetical protein Q8S73_45470 [Deltaproteobacteria bacterium]|nr:hypothetical protein [Myxococcales bacterium]MDP3221420.1 hypothetical protein [Deltaproteobacteria bacterium]
MARTGFGSRLLLGQRSTGLLGRALLTFFVLSFGLGIAAWGAVSGVKGLREALDPSSALYRLRHLSSSVQSAGTLRFSATVHASEGDRPPLCEVVHEHYVSGKNGGWRRDASWFRSAGATVDHGALRVRAHEPAVFDPLDMLVVPADREPWFRTVLADVPLGGRLRAHCIAHGETVFLEGCVEGGFLTGCGVTPLTVTTGDGTAQPRIDAHASAVAGRLAGGAAALVAALAWLWYVLRARPLADALLRRAGPVLPFAAWPQVFGVAGAALLCAIVQVANITSSPAGSALSRGRPGYLFGLVVCAVAGVLVVVVRHRRRNLDRAMAPVREAETVPLRDARGGVVELAVRVRDGGAPATGLLDKRPHAWVELRVEETIAVGKTQVTRLVAREYWPARIPVVDASGDGLIDPKHAEVDLRSSVTTFKEGSISAVARALAASPVGPLRPSATHLRWSVEESVLDPGETLYVLGQCRRIEDPKAAGSYRADSTMAIVGGGPEDRIILHAGDERSLLRSIGLEGGYLDLLTAALAGVAVSLAATMVALWSL